jgi:hypothetical protein
MTLIILNCLCELLQLYFLIKRKGHLVVNLTGVLQIFYLYIYSEQTITVTNYIGAINAIHIIVIVVILLCILIALLFKKLASNNTLIFCLVIFAIGSILTFYYYYKVKNSCDYWAKGINGQM